MRTAKQRGTLRGGGRPPEKVDENSTSPDVLVANQGDDAARGECLRHQTKSIVLHDDRQARRSRNSTMWR